MRGSDFKPGGIILTAFDSQSMWVYNINANTRYPLPDTQPCGSNCRLSPDAKWITYVDTETDSYAKMRLDGTERTPLVDYAADVEWWSTDTLLIWTPGKDAYLRAETGSDRTYLNVEGVSAVQPGGHWGLLNELDGDHFKRSLVDLNVRGLDGVAGGSVDLGAEKRYFDASAWSPDGKWFAYVAPGQVDSKLNIAGGELFGVQPIDGSAPTQWTDLTSQYGAARINGEDSGELSWSPDSTQIAFWVTPLIGPDPAANIGNSMIHVLNVNTGEIKAYCDFTTTEVTPNPPRLIWSPDSTHIAFGGNVPGDNKGYLLLALDTTSGVFTELSDGIYPQLGGADPVAWGFPP